MSDEKLYKAYCAMCREKGMKPLPFEQWKSPKRFSALKTEVFVGRKENP